MKPEIHKVWENALGHLKKVEELYEDGKFQEAAKEADLAFIFGISAIRLLAEELKLNDLSVIEENAFYESLERRSREFGGKHYTPKEIVEWVRKTLKRLSQELPADTLRPLQ